MKRTTLSLVALAALIVAAPSFAADTINEEDRGTVRKPDYVAIPHPEGNSRLEQNSTGLVKQTFADYDTNRDGIVAPEEWHGTADDYGRLDANEDGVLTPRELSSYLQFGIDPFGEMDTNHDGYMSRSEWKDRSHSFRKFDANRDGVLTREEFYSEVD